MPLLELKYIAGVFVDYTALKEIHKTEIEKNSILERIILDKDAGLMLKDQLIELMQRKLDIATPAWYDRFTIGFGVGAGLLLTILLLLK